MYIYIYIHIYIIHVYIYIHIGLHTMKTCMLYIYIHIVHTQTHSIAVTKGMSHVQHHAFVPRPNIQLSCLVAVGDPRCIMSKWTMSLATTGQDSWDWGALFLQMGNDGDGQVIHHSLRKRGHDGRYHFFFDWCLKKYDCSFGFRRVSQWSMMLSR